MDLLMKDRPGEALPLFDASPLWPDKHNKALCLEMLERYGEAEAAYVGATMAASSPAQSAQSLVGAANTCRHRRDEQGNDGYLQTALESDPKWAQAHFLLSAANVRRNDLEKATQFLISGYGAAMDSDADDTLSFIEAYAALPNCQPRIYRRGAATLLDMLYAEVDRPGHVKLLHQLVTAVDARPDFVGACEPGWCFVSEHFHRGSVFSNFVPLLKYLVEQGQQVCVWALGELKDQDALQELRQLCKVWTCRPPAMDATVCLDGHTGTTAALRQLSRRLSPVQVDYLGYPYTTGSVAFDAKLVDETTDPPGQEEHYTETLVRLPCCMWTWAPDPEWPSAELGSPRPYHILVCQNFKKLRPGFLGACGRILQAQPRASIHFRCTLLADTQSLFQSWVLDHLPPDVRFRAHHAHSPSRPDLCTDLASYHVALDTWPYNGTVTTMECLYSGTPVVTFQQQFHRGRTSSSILAACGLTKYIATDVDGFVDSALLALEEPLAPTHETVRACFRNSDIMKPEVLGKAFRRAVTGLVKKSRATP